MSIKYGYYKCETCGNIVKVIQESGVDMVCCGNTMTHIEAKSEPNEKHLPVIDAESNGIQVRIGEVEHPMTDDHYIQFIEVIGDGCSMIQELLPGFTPCVFFPITAGSVKAVRAYCNIHGLWENDQINDEGGLYNV